MPRRTFGPQSRFRIGAALVQPDRLIVTLDEEEHALEPRVMDVLVVLAEHRNEVISAEQLLIEVWRGTFYGDNPVHKAINALRRVFGDDLKSPRYIETIRKRGYRLIANVAYPDDYRRVATRSAAWSDASPFVGLSAFDSEHASVFFGRSRTTAELLTAMRRQLDQQRRFVLIVGASGCGKTSLIQAGAIPLLRQDGGFDGLHALSVANCDLAGVGVENAVLHLADALGDWALGDRTVFPPQPSGDLAAELLRDPGRIGRVIEDAFRRQPTRATDEHTQPHLLLVIDHAETLVSTRNTDPMHVEAFSRLLDRLCDTPRVLVVMAVRGDFYLELVETIPGIAARKASDGHLDVLTPRPGEIAQIIRIPAALAGLTFEEDAQTAAHLDDVLRDAAAAHPDALPLLQHTLQSLYERRSESGELGFTAYRDIGGLEGALAHRAEEVFASLPEASKASIDGLLSQMIVMQPENESVSARRVAWSFLNDDARALAEAFVRARLFVAELGEGLPGFRVAHEALLRQWPRARDWTQDNRRILQARVRLQRAAARWVEEGRKDDHLLNPGRPLAEAMEAAKSKSHTLGRNERLFLDLSEKSSLRRRLMRRVLIAGMATLTLTSTLLALLATNAKSEAEKSRKDALGLIGYMLIELTDQLRPTASMQPIDSISTQAISFLERQSTEKMKTDDLVNYSRSLRTRGEVLSSKGDSVNALKFFMRADETARDALSASPDNPAAIAEAGQTAYWLGYQFRNNQNPYDASRQWKRYSQLSRKLTIMEPDNPAWMMEKSFSDANLGVLEQDNDRCDMAMMVLTPSARTMNEIARSNREKPTWQYNAIVARSWISRCQLRNGLLELAALGFQNDISDLRSLTNSHPQAVEWSHQLSNLLHLGATLSIDRGDIQNAEKMISESTEILEMITKLQPENARWLRNYANSLAKEGEIAAISGDREYAISRLEKAMAIVDDYTKNSASSSNRRIKANIQLRLASVRRLPSDIGLIDSSIETLDSIYASHSDDENAAVSLAKALMDRGNWRSRLRQHAESRLDWQRAHEILSPFASRSRDPRILSPWVYSGLKLDTPQSRTDAISLSRSGYAHPDFQSILRTKNKNVHD